MISLKTFKRLWHQRSSISATNYCRDDHSPLFSRRFDHPTPLARRFTGRYGLQTYRLVANRKKGVAQVLSRRGQRVIEIFIQDTQQGSVHERQLSKTVMMMMAHLISATPEPDQDVDSIRSILLLNFCKACDTY